jgi:hypothetical protein
MPETLERRSASRAPERRKTMKKSLAVVLAALIAYAVPSSAFAVAVATPVRAVTPVVQQCSDAASHVHEAARGRIRGNYEIVSGPVAVSHLRDLTARRQELMEKAARRMRDRGFKPTDIVMVARNDGSGGEIAPVEDSFSNQEGEIVFWSWDDGANETWEGVIYVEDYVTGAFATWESQLDISTEDEYPLWESYVGGGGGGPREPVYQTHLFQDEPPQLASSAAEYALDRIRGGTSRDIQRVGLRRWAACTGAGCAGSAIGCIATGPKWAVCTGIWCAGWAIGCGIHELIR